MRFFCLYVILMGVGVGTVFGVAYAALSLGWTEHLFDAVGGGLACFAFELWVAAHAVHPSGDWTVEWPQLTRAHVKRGLTEFKNDALDWLEIMIVGLLWLMLVVSAL
jgi:hypothetical protein